MPDVNVMQVNVTACPATIDEPDPGVCKSTMDYVFQKYLPSHRVATTLGVVLAEKRSARAG